ncbi:MAG: 6-pyruvoyl trahydropterin synthase family protein [Bacteroidales bacterium]|jgi:6-pyruvoyltetrahydropterin/6-carboxytetrahydropterin synthase
MSKIRITKEFRFESAHALLDYDGPCKNIHGHSYKMAVTLIGEPLTDTNSPKNGMVMDFGILKQIVNDCIVKPFDHALVLNADTKNVNSIEVKSLSEKLILVKYQPSCENFLLDFAERIKNKLPDNVKLFSIRLDETSNSYAEWFASDNE